MTEGNEMLFVGIRDPNDIRKSLLESSKSIIECLQKYEKLRFIREEKEKEVHRFKTIVSEIDSSMNKLKSLLPKTTLEPISEEDEEKALKEQEAQLHMIEEVRVKTIEKEKDREEKFLDEEIKAIKRKAKTQRTPRKPKIKTEIEVKPIEKVVKKEPVIEKTVKKPATELSKLEDELKDIESKLSKL